MQSSGMWGCVALVTTDVSGERTASIIMVEWISELGATLGVTSWCELDSFHTNYGEDTFLWNVGSDKNHMESLPIGLHSL
jgi:hypothetical protein